MTSGLHNLKMLNYLNILNESDQAFFIKSCMKIIVFKIT